jgi:hypothetical protein
MTRTSSRFDRLVEALVEMNICFDLTVEGTKARIEYWASLPSSVGSAQ